MSIPRILVFDRPAASIKSLIRALENEGFQVELTENVARVRDALTLGECDLLLGGSSLDPGGLADAVAGGEHTPLVLFDDFGNVGDELRALAFEIVVRPAAEADVIRSVRGALERNRLRAENRRLRHVVGERFEFGSLVSRDARMRRVFDTVESVADSRASLLIHGESGTGKTVLARTVHEHSSQSGAPFVVVNCGALPASLLESELFGHVRGAFTGAVRNREGKFEAADGGTIFLDEIATASLDLQVKLLRVIEEGRFERVGESETRQVDVRLIAATNCDLAREVDEGRFRADLYYRINVVGIEVPPLRDRPGDVPLLAERFLERFEQRYQRGIDGIDAGAFASLCSHPWPGNVRELENTIERAVLLARGSTLAVEDFWPEAHSTRSSAPRRPSLGATYGSAGEPAAEAAVDGGDLRGQDIPLGPLKKALEIPERWLILRVLRSHGGNRQRTAETLGINRTTLFNKMRKYHLLAFPAKAPKMKDEPGKPDSGFGKAG